MDTLYIQEELKKWYILNKRILPWRDISDPYKIWISEIILQQTRVAQGYNYYLRFIERFPNIEALANAPEDDVLKYWQGLGYYSRARNLHKAAIQMMKEHNGIFPTEYDDVLHLKGIGTYTAAAICSFAYKMPYPVIDGNVYRVLARLFNISTPIDSTEGKKEFAYLAQELMDQKQPDIYNQAIMEFGALQCIPISPKCNECPILNICASVRNNTTHLLPIKSKRTQVINRYFNYLLFSEKDTTTFLQKREKKDIWQHLYEFPLLESDKLFSIEELLVNTTFLELTKGIEQVTVKTISPKRIHILSHQRIQAQLFYITISNHNVHFSQYTQVAFNDVDKYAVPRLIELLLENKVL